MRLAKNFLDSWACTCTCRAKMIWCRWIFLQQFLINMETNNIGLGKKK